MKKFQRDKGEKGKTLEGRMKVKEDVRSMMVLMLKVRDEALSA